jgi:hypothetical protein
MRILKMYSLTNSTKCFFYNLYWNVPQRPMCERLGIIGRWGLERNLHCWGHALERTVETLVSSALFASWLLRHKLPPPLWAPFVMAQSHRAMSQNKSLLLFLCFVLGA